MTGSLGGVEPVFGGAYRGLAWLLGALATIAAVVVSVVLAVVFAATVAVIVIMGAATIGLFALAVRARRSVHAKDPTLLEAGRVGDSWIAYGWDRNGR